MAVQQGCQLINSETLRNKLLWERDANSKISPKHSTYIELPGGSRQYILQLYIAPDVRAV